MGTRSKRRRHDAASTGTAGNGALNGCLEDTKRRAILRDVSVMFRVSLSEEVTRPEPG
jgi:hypothetical protein